MSFRRKPGLSKGKNTPKSCRASEAILAVLATKTDKSRDESIFADKKSKANKRNNPVLDRKENGTSQNHADT